MTLYFFEIVFYKFHQALYPTIRLCRRHITSLPNDKILDWSKLKVFADDKNDLQLETMIFVFDRVENIEVTSIFSFYHNVFKFFYSGSGLCGKELNVTQIMNVV